MRLRTLPLAISGVLMGSALANLNGIDGKSSITLLALLTAICLQIISNLANDYGDFKKGTDNNNRIGNTRALQSGNITSKEMMVLIFLFVGMSLFFGLWLLNDAMEGNFNLAFLLFLFLGIAAIVSAVKYTVGKNAYGYSGFGDLFVFVFFGLVSVFGVYLLHKKLIFDWSLDKYILLPAIAIGLLSTAVLNTNNIRDVDNDKASSKNTLVVKLGVNNARMYHWLLLLGALFCMFVFVTLNYFHFVQFLSFLGFVPIIMQAYKVQTTDPSPLYNIYLKQLSLSTLLFVILFIVFQTVSLFIVGYKVLQQLPS